MTEDNLIQSVDEEVKETWETTLEKEISVVPYVDIYENENEFILTANLPGVEKDDVHIKLEEGSLYLFGKNNYKSDLERKYILKETNSGNFYRKFNLSDNIDNSKINATYENGRLTVILPKHDRVKPRTINVK